MIELSGVINFSIQAALLVVALLIVPCIYRIAAAETAAERLQAIDTITVLLIGIIALLALNTRESQLLDIAIALAALGFVGTLAVARFLAEGKAF